MAGVTTFFRFATKMSKREIAAAAAKKYVLSLDNATANPPADRFHSVITLITLGLKETASSLLTAPSLLTTLLTCPRPAVSSLTTLRLPADRPSRSPTPLAATTPSRRSRQS